MPQKYIWYACYGSNLLPERFRYYITGGKYQGRHYNGCRDKSLWLESYGAHIPGGMYFAQESGRWQGHGVAFFTLEMPGQTYVRLYKITEEQLGDVLQQEGQAWYGNKLYLGEGKYDLPIYTLTNPGEEPLSENGPSQEYLAVIKQGIKETFPQLTEQEIDKYLKFCRCRYCLYSNLDYK